MRIGYAGFAYLPEVLQSVAKLEGFALLYPERWLERAAGSPDIYLHDIVEALLSQAASLKTITIANNEEGKIQLHSELCDFRPFTKLIRLNILADTYSLQFWESLPPSLQQLQLEIYIEDLDQGSLADGIKQFAKNKVTMLPSLRLLVIWIRLGAYDDPLQDHEINQLEDLVRLLKTVGIIFKVVAGPYFQIVFADSTEETTGRTLRIG